MRVADCVRGCTVFKRHRNDCPVPDRSAGAWTSAGLDEQQRDQLMDGDQALCDGRPRGRIWIGQYGGLEVWKDCGGCQPRPADHGCVCEGCHTSLTGWLSQLPWLHAWLTENITPGTAAGAKQDWQMSRGTDGTPAPLRVAVLDVRTLLTDRTLELEDCARDVFDRPTRGVFDLVTAVRFLNAWLTKIEADEDLVVHMIELLEDVFRKARTLVPWEDRPRRISGIICPHCDRTTLEVRPGSEDVSCRTCNQTIRHDRYEIWTRALVHEAQQAALAAS